MSVGTETTNGDGFGVGWYGEGREPGIYHSISPAWNDRNLKELAKHIRSHLFLAHIRATTGTAIQQTNCHPFRHDQWLWMHNGLIRGFDAVKRELVLAIDPGLYPSIEGSTDTELMFYLALSLGLSDDPISAVERMAGMIEAIADRHGIKNALQMTLATTDGERLWVFRYSTERCSRSLYYSTNVPHTPGALPGQSTAGRPVGGDAFGGIRTAVRSSGRLEGGSGIHLRHCAGRRR